MKTINGFVCIGSARSIARYKEGKTKHAPLCGKCVRENENRKENHKIIYVGVNICYCCESNNDTYIILH